MKKAQFIVLTSLLFSFSVEMACSPSKANDTEDKAAHKSYIEKKKINVKTYMSSRGAFSKELSSNGVLVAKEKAVLPFEVNGQIKNIKVKEGQKVKAGTLIASIDAFTFKKRLNDAQNNSNKALIDLEDLLLGYGFSLSDTAVTPANVLKMCKIRSGHNTAHSALQEAERNLNHTKITAPISGVVSNMLAKENNHSSQYKYCCQIIDNSSMEVEFHVLEGELGMVAKGQKVAVYPFALPELKKMGVITSVNPTVENGLIKITAEIPNRDGTLLDGMNVKLLVKKEVPNCMIIPKSAILYRQNRKVVFVHKNGIALWVYVETGMENSNQICITDDSIKEGDEVIISDNLNLAHETPVTVVGE